MDLEVVGAAVAVVGALPWVRRDMRHDIGELRRDLNGRVKELRRDLDGADRGAEHPHRQEPAG